MYHGHAICWVLGETLEAARLGAAAVEADYEPLPSLIDVREAIAAESFQGGRPQVARGDVEPAMAGSAHVFSGETEMAGQEHFYLETHCCLVHVDESGQVFVQSSTQHPTETQEIVAHVLGRHSHDVTVQCLRMGGGFGGKEMQPHGYAAVAALGATLTGRPVRLRLNRTQDLTLTGKRHGFHAQWRVGFDGDGRLQALGRHAHLRRRLEPRPVRAGAGPGPVPHRQRLLDPARPGERPGRADPQDLADGLPGLRRAAGHARDRGHPGPVRAAARHRPGRPAPAQFLRRRPGHAVRPAGAARAARDRLLGPGRSRRRRGPAGHGDRRVQRDPRARQARARGDPGEVRDLVQLHRLQPGRRARARLQGRLGADQPRRHRDGPGPAHQDAAGRGDRARRPAVPRPAGPDPHRQGAEHLCHGGQLRRRPQRCRGQARLRADHRAARQQSTPAAGCPGRSWSARPTSAGCSCGPPASTGPRACTGTPPRCAASRSSTSRTALPPPRWRSTASPAPTAPDGSTSCTTSATPSRRWSTSARSRAGSSRAPAG